MPSYSGLLRLPAWGLYDERGKLVASVRAHSNWEARAIFKEKLPLADQAKGKLVRRIYA